MIVTATTATASAVVSKYRPSTPRTFTMLLPRACTAAIHTPVRSLSPAKRLTVRVGTPLPRRPFPSPSAANVDHTLESSEPSRQDTGSAPSVPGWAVLGATGAVLADFLDGPGHVPLAVAVLAGAFISLASSSSASTDKKKPEEPKLLDEDLEATEVPQAATFSAQEQAPVSPSPTAVSSSPSNPQSPSSAPTAANTAPKVARDISPVSQVAATATTVVARTSPPADEQGLPASSGALLSAATSPLSSTGSLAASCGKGMGRVMTAGSPNSTRQPTPRSAVTPLLALVGAAAACSAAWMCFQGAQIATAGPVGLCAAALLLLGAAFGIEASKPRPPRVAWSA
mmetsp:Transcript_16915/g.47210  ORF Transcript_16915/g.47210 Transcript_16915/m.47210 type:complete len:342 (-) Transcript_16915:244-1269(-)